MSNRIVADIKVPTFSNGFTKIKINYEWIYDSDGLEIEFILPDHRSFGWSCDSRWYPRKFGTDDGVYGSPNDSIVIYSRDQPINSIVINFIFKRNVTDSDLKNLEITAVYAFEE